jgi:hypothetical protein
MGTPVPAACPSAEFNCYLKKRSNLIAGSRRFPLPARFSIRLALPIFARLDRSRK